MKRNPILTWIRCKRSNCPRVFQNVTELEAHQNNCNDEDSRLFPFPSPSEENPCSGNQVFQMKKVRIPIHPIHSQSQSQDSVSSFSLPESNPIKNELEIKPAHKILYPNLKDLRIVLERKNFELPNKSDKKKKRKIENVVENSNEIKNRTGRKRARRSCTLANKKENAVGNGNDKDSANEVDVVDISSDDSDLSDFEFPFKSSSSFKKCQLCNKKITQKQMARHMRTHSGKTRTPFACPFKGCRHRFARKEHVVPHLIKSHQDSSPVMNVCFCHFCDMAFGNSSDLIFHAEANHSGEKSFRCKEKGCGEIFPKLIDLKNHRANSQHGEWREKQTHEKIENYNLNLLENPSQNIIDIIVDIPIEELVTDDIVEVNPFGGEGTPVHASTLIIDHSNIDFGVEDEEFMEFGDWAEYLSTEHVLMQYGYGYEYDFEEDNSEIYYNDELSMDVPYHFLKAPITPSDEICIKPAYPYSQELASRTIQTESNSEQVTEQTSRRYSKRLRQLRSDS